jgi:hypothetical protein
MRERYLSLIARLRAPQGDRVHFHSGPQGEPAVCDNPGCTAPHLDV